MAWWSWPYPTRIWGTLIRRTLSYGVLTQSALLPLATVVLAFSVECDVAERIELDPHSGTARLQTELDKG